MPDFITPNVPQKHQQQLMQQAQHSQLVSKRQAQAKLNITDVTQYTRLGSVAIYTTEQILYQLGKHGVILFKNGAKDTEEFSQVVREHSYSVTLDPARSACAGVAQLLEPEFERAGLRCVNGNSPFWAEQSWFYCLQTDDGGAKIKICDGVNLWQSLSVNTQRFFINNDICYERVVESHKWRQLVVNHRADRTQIDQVQFADLQQMLADRHDCKFVHLKNDDIYYRLEVSAIQSSRFNNQLAFANNLLGSSGYYQVPKISLARSGDPIDSKIIDEIIEISEAVTSEISLQKHDVLLLDNHRVMHGRGQQVSANQKLYSAISHV